MSSCTCCAGKGWTPKSFFGKRNICPDCEGSGVQTISCSDCKGKGWISKNIMGQKNFCKNCDGSGRIDAGKIAS